MIMKESWVFITDNTNVRWKKIFHLYKGFNRRRTTISYFIKGSARVVEPPRLEYKGFKYKFIIKGNILRSLLVRTRFPQKLKDHTNYKFSTNSVIIIKKKQDPKSKFLNGPILRIFRRRRFLTLFKKVI